MDNHWRENTPKNLWRFEPDPPADIWQSTCARAFPLLGLDSQVQDMDTAIAHCLGEYRFGDDPWELSKVKRVYYYLKPCLPRRTINWVKSLSANFSPTSFQLGWPIEPRYVQFQWEVARQVLSLMGKTSLQMLPFWPDGKKFAFVLTHDIESAEGQEFALQVADLEERFGFRSSFNFVPELYDLDFHLMHTLRERGFEIGVHGLKHDGKLFSSRHIFMERVEWINHYLRELGAVGFRSPLMMRNPEWMQSLEIEYDLSFFDTDPYEPIPGGCMNIWPFRIGKFVELPYTLVQDCTLGIVLGEKTPKIWLEKSAFIERYHGMALLNSHPDYLQQPQIWNMYTEFLMQMKENTNHWHALPKDVARWWQKREDQIENTDGSKLELDRAYLENGQIRISP